MTRRPMTPSRRARILATHGGRCAALGCEITGPLEIDHRIPIWFAIDAKSAAVLEADANLRPLCVVHHAIKTAADATLRAKTKRQNGETPPRLPRRPLRSRGFDRTRLRGFDGVVRLRVQEISS